MLGWLQCIARSTTKTGAEPPRTAHDAEENAVRLYRPASHYVMPPAPNSTWKIYITKHDDCLFLRVPLVTRMLCILYEYEYSLFVLGVHK